ncbi:MAG: BamA/TamA family outer membrane protein [Gemmatimonadaceae bacterium]|nr:BamA/TamA family outer membrane protein [Gemmatimonadaceae bacterium]
MTTVTRRGRLAPAALGVLATAAGLAFAASPAHAQEYFGQNQVQYDQFDWKVMETEHFLIHYYPVEQTAVYDAARMAERAYARLSRILGYQFREKKPIVLFASRSDFGQNNVTGDLGEGVGGVTEPMRHRIILPFTGDYRSFEHVLTHEMVHEFQYDIFARGKAGGGLQALQQNPMPDWYAEGMAEYLSIGPDHPFTDSWMRDAALNGNIPTIEQMTQRPDQYFPYRFGESLWGYVGARWGDETIGNILRATPNVGVERAVKRELGMSLEDLSQEWKESLQDRFLPGITQLDRARRFAQPVLNEKKSGGQVFVAPSLSPDGKYIAFLSNGSFLRGEVFIDLWLGDAQTGKRIKRLIKSTTDPNFEELRLLYSQSSFSPDGRLLAFTAQRAGKDVLYLLDVRRKKVIRRFSLPGVEGVTSPTWSPDGKRIVVSGDIGGITDLYMIDADGKNFRRLTADRYGDLQPQWSPDGKTIAFTSDRGEATDFETLRFNKWRITLLDLETMQVTVVPGQAGLNLNPQWAPDGRSIAYLSDRTGISNLFLYDLDAKQHYQLTNVASAINAFTEYSPAITWARGADRLAFTYYENGDYTIWGINNPRSLKREPFHDVPMVAGPIYSSRRDSSRVAAAAPAMDTTPVATRMSTYRAGGTSFRSSGVVTAGSADAPRHAVTVAAMLDSAALALPDTATFRLTDYKVRFQPDYIAQPSIGYVQDNYYGRGMVGGTTIILSDLLGNNRLAISAAVNGRLSDAQLYTAWANYGHRVQYATGIDQYPYYFLTGDQLVPTSNDPNDPIQAQLQEITRFIFRDVFAVGMYPLNRFTRLEFGARFNNIDRQTLYIHRFIDFQQQVTTGYYLDDIKNQPGINNYAVNAAWVSDNALWGYTGPISGRRYRFQVEPQTGSWQWIDYLADYRRYDPILFNFLTVATRGLVSITAGRDEHWAYKYIGRPEYIRGYDRENFFSYSCGAFGSVATNCNAQSLLGSRIAVANAELRFPVIRRLELGVLPIALPPIEGALFYDAGMAWSRGNKVQLKAPTDPAAEPNTRYPYRSYGAGVRVNFFGYAILRWDYAKPLSIDHKPFWTFSIGPNF